MRAMSEPNVDQLRDQLRSLGYLTHGIERWFELDPWRSRTFWRQLLAVGSKAATAASLSILLPLLAIMALRNRPIGVEPLALLAVVYEAGAWVASFALFLFLALLFRAGVSAAINRPGFISAAAAAPAAVIAAALTLWWARFSAPPAGREIAIGLPLIVLAFSFTATVFSAALLSFTIHETHTIPTVRYRRRTWPMAGAGAALMTAALFLAWGREGVAAPPPLQVPIAPAARRIALIAVDGLSAEIASAQKNLLNAMVIATAPPLASGSSATRWASIGTGTPERLHGVRAIDGVVLAGAAQPLQGVSAADFLLADLAPLVRLARRVPLPPTVRKRDYVWEVFAQHGIRSAAVNWWVSADRISPTIDAVSQERVFRAAEASRPRTPQQLAAAIDGAATTNLLSIARRETPQFVTAYLPALDIVLNRLDLDATARLSESVRVLETLASTIVSIRAFGYEVIVVGIPGEGQRGHSVIASTIPLTATPGSVDDVAPTLCALAGFPASQEMPGRSLVPAAVEPRVATYGDRQERAHDTATDDEYFRSLKSLGYIR
jgi:hypothetical protein